MHCTLNGFAMNQSRDELLTLALSRHLHSGVALPALLMLGICMANSHCRLLPVNLCDRVNHSSQMPASAFSRSFLRTGRTPRRLPQARRSGARLSSVTCPPACDFLSRGTVMPLAPGTCTNCPPPSPLNLLKQLAPQDIYKKSSALCTIENGP